MPRFAANLTMLFTELPMLHRFQAARDARFDGVEVLFPYDLPPADFGRALDDSGLPLVLMNTPAGDLQAGERGFAAVAGAKDRFQSGLHKALEIAQILAPRHVHIMSGNADGPQAFQTLVENLTYATSIAPSQNFLVEPLNPHDMPGYFLNSFDLADRIIAAVNAPNLGLQFDAYHAHRITHDVLATWRKYHHATRHIQIADHPGRHEPGTGEIDFSALMSAVSDSGYQGWVSAEYTPATTTSDGLNWRAVF